MLGQPAGSADEVGSSALDAVRLPYDATLRGLRACDPDEEFASPLREAWARLELLTRELEAVEPCLRLYALDDVSLGRAWTWFAAAAGQLGIELVDGTNGTPARAHDLAVLVLDREQASGPAAAMRWGALNREHERTRIFCLHEDGSCGAPGSLSPMDLLHATSGPSGARRLVRELAPRRALERVHAAYEDLLHACRRPEVARHAERWRQFEPVLREESRLRSAAQGLAETGEHDWLQAIEPLRSRLLQADRGRPRQLAQAQTASWIRAVDEWFQGDAGLPSLVEEELAPLQEAIHEHAWCAARAALVVETAGGQAHEWIPADLLASCESAGVSVAALALHAAREVPHAPDAAPLEPLLSATDIPLRPTLGFLRLLRGDGPLRTRIFGKPDAPRTTLPAEDKARWLSGDARGILEGLVIGRLGDFAQEQLEQSTTLVARRFARSLCSSLRRKMRARTRRLDSELDRVERLFPEQDDLGQHLARLEEAILAADAPLVELLHGGPWTPKLAPALA